jgi:hypothetical protein
MTLKEQLQTLVQDDAKVEEILKLTNKPNAYQKYMQSEKGRAAKKRANAKYQGPSVIEPGSVQNHITWLRNSLAEPKCFLLTDLWESYCNSDYNNKECRITRHMYKSELDHATDVKTVCPHFRDDKKYYTSAYEVLPLEDN